MSKGKLYTEDQVAELLTAYKLSDLGTYSVAEVRLKNPNSFDAMTEKSKQWLTDIADVSIEYKAHAWFKMLNSDFAAMLRHNNRGQSDTAIYKEVMLKN